MKRKLLIPLLFVTTSILASTVRAQESPAPDVPSRSESKTAIDQAAQAYQQAEEKVTTLSSVGLSTQPPSNKGSLRDTLQPAVVESFVARQRLQQAELAELRRRLAEIEQSLAERQKRMDTIVDARVDELLAGRTGQAVTKVQARVQGVVRGLAQVPENDHGKQTLRPITVGDKVKAGYPLAEIECEDAAGSRVVANIPSPIDGVVVEKNVNVGNIVKPADTLFQISSAMTGDAAVRTVAPHDTDEASARSTDEFDHETRQRLAQVDLQAAQEEYDAAEKEFSAAKGSYDVGTMSFHAFAQYQKALRQAKAELDRAKVKVEGLARQRTQVEATSSRFDSALPGRGRSDATDQFDFETRVRLAQVDVEEAQAVCDDAQHRYKAHLEGNKQAPGTTPKAELDSLAAKVRIADAKLQHARLSLEGLNKERTELEAAAESAVAEAQAERQRAVAKVATCQADYEATEAVVSERKADVEGASAAYDYRQKVYNRIKTLVVEKGVEQKLADESEQNLAAAEAALAAAKAAVITAKANATRSKSAVEEARAEVAIAEARLKAAQARRERLLHNAQGNGDPSAKAPGGDQSKSDAPAVLSKGP